MGDNSNRSGAGKVVMELAERHNCPTQAEARRRILEIAGIAIGHQKFSQWIAGDTSFPNDFADLLTRALDLSEAEQVELALALSFGQKSRQLQ